MCLGDDVYLVLDPLALEEAVEEEEESTEVVDTVVEENEDGGGVVAKEPKTEEKGKVLQRDANSKKMAILA